MISAARESAGRDLEREEEEEKVDLRADRADLVNLAEEEFLAVPLHGGEGEIRVFPNLILFISSGCVWLTEFFCFGSSGERSGESLGKAQEPRGRI